MTLREFINKHLYIVLFSVVLNGICMCRKKTKHQDRDDFPIPSWNTCKFSPFIFLFYNLINIIRNLQALVALVILSMLGEATPTAILEQNLEPEHREARYHSNNGPPFGNNGPLKALGGEQGLPVGCPNCKILRKSRTI